VTAFIARLKQRKLVQWALAYVAFSFALLQGVDIVAQRFAWPDSIERLLILALALGFLVALILAWYHGERGAQRVTGTELLILALLLAIGGGLLWRFARAPSTPNVVQGSSPDAAQRISGNVIPDSAAAATPAGLRAPIVPPVPIPAKSVAVLPFVNESGDKDQQYFSDGLSEDLINALSQVAGLKVINRDSSFQFRDSKDSVQTIASKLGVAHLLEGTVQRLDDQVRISAELVNVSDGSTLWSQQYDRSYKNLFQLQDDITKAVADALKAKLLMQTGAVVQTDRPPNGSLAAYNDVLQGRFYSRRGTEADARKAIDFYTAATRLDPDYALAWAALGSANTGLAGNYLGGNEAAQTWDKARAEVQTALSLDPNLWVAHSVDKFILISVDHDWARAEIEAERAYQLNPDDFFDLATVRGASGRTRQAVELIQRGLPSDPLCLSCYDYLARLLPGLGRFDEAGQAARKALQLQPGSGFSRLHLAYIEAMRGDAAAALQAAQQQPPGKWRGLMLAFALQVGSDRVAADKALQTVIAKQGSSAAYYIAEMYALRRDPDSMFKWLERARKNRDYSVQLLLTDPAILRYKSDPRFAAFCRKVGLPDTTDAKALP
jgi:TolB-like protein